jgi:hypothetical protein
LSLKYLLLAAVILVPGAPLSAQTMPPAPAPVPAPPPQAYAPPPTSYSCSGPGEYGPVYCDPNAAQYGSNYRGAHPFGAYVGGPDPGGTYFSRYQFH